jgi:hypothetical protein
LNLCKVSKTPPFQNLLHPWVQKKSHGARSGEYGWWVSTAVFPKRKPNFAHTHTLFFKMNIFSFFLKKIAKHTCKHLEKIPEKLTRSTQRSVTWQTGSEHRRFTVPSGRTLNYVSFVRKIQIPEIFGSPLVC